MNDDRLNSNNVGFYFDYQNGEYGYNTSANRGADTFSPFKNDTTNVYIWAERNTSSTSTVDLPNKYLTTDYFEYSNGNYTAKKSFTCRLKCRTTFVKNYSYGYFWIYKNGTQIFYSNGETTTPNYVQENYSINAGDIFRFKGASERNYNTRQTVIFHSTDKSWVTSLVNSYVGG